MDIGKYQMVEVFDDPERTRAFLGGLAQSREYRIHVKAMTNAGAGETDYVDVKTASPGRKLILFSDIKLNMLLGYHFIHMQKLASITELHRWTGEK